MLGMLDKVKAILANPGNKEDFLKLVSRIFPPLDPRYTEIERAYDSMKDAFREYYRESGERYFEHLRAVALIMMVYLRVKDHELIMAGLIHDGPEDIKYWPVERVERVYGRRVAMYTERLKKGDVADFVSEEERDHAYHELFATADRGFFLIKLPDRLHNLLTLGACKPEKIRRKIEETKLYYLPYAEKHLILYHEILAAIEELEIELKRSEEPATGSICV